jgi:hypothetical protein
MKIDSQIIDGINALGPEHAALEEDCRAFVDSYSRLQASGERYLKAVTLLHSIAFGKSTLDMRGAIVGVRFMQREHGLLALDASRKLAQVAAKNLEISEKMAALISTEGEQP